MCEEFTILPVEGVVASEKKFAKVTVGGAGTAKGPATAGATAPGTAAGPAAAG